MPAADQAQKTHRASQSIDNKLVGLIERRLQLAVNYLAAEIAEISGELVLCSVVSQGIVYLRSEGIRFPRFARQT
jgi:hypothetical protein